MEEELPVDVVDEVGHGGGDLPRPGEGRCRQVVEREVRAIGARLGQRQQRPLQLLGMLTPEPLLKLAVLGVQRGTTSRVEQARDDVRDAARVEHVDGLRSVLRSDLHGGVLARRRRASDQERQLETRALELARDVHHLVE